MIRRILLCAALVAASLSRLHCQLILRYEVAEIRQPFLGCFQGAITEPPAGQITVVLEKPPTEGEGETLIGCLRATDPRFSATMAGGVLKEATTQARLSAVPDGGRPAFVVLVTREPSEGNATALTVVNETDMPFKRARSLPRCAPALTCADLGTEQNFLPDGAR
jgi:hypothetical protein